MVAVTETWPGITLECERYKPRNQGSQEVRRSMKVAEDEKEEDNEIDVQVAR